MPGTRRVVTVGRDGRGQGVEEWVGGGHGECLWEQRFGTFCWDGEQRNGH